MTRNNDQLDSNPTNQPKIGFWTGQVISISISLVTLTILSIAYGSNPSLWWELLARGTQLHTGH